METDDAFVIVATVHLVFLVTIAQRLRRAKMVAVRTVIVKMVRFKIFIWIIIFIIPAASCVVVVVFVKSLTYGESTVSSLSLSLFSPLSLYLAGICICNAGWRGQNCTRVIPCEPSDCAGRGVCMLGTCIFCFV